MNGKPGDSRAEEAGFSDKKKYKGRKKKYGEPPLGSGGGFYGVKSRRERMQNYASAGYRGLFPGSRCIRKITGQPGENGELVFVCRRRRGGG